MYFTWWEAIYWYLKKVKLESELTDWVSKISSTRDSNHRNRAEVSDNRFDWWMHT